MPPRTLLSTMYAKQTANLIASEVMLRKNYYSFKKMIFLIEKFKLHMFEPTKNL